MSRIIVVFLFLFVSLTAHAQSFTYGELSLEEYYFPNKLDSIAPATVIKEVGTARLQVNDVGRLMVMFDYHVRIKIYRKAGFREANIVVPLRKSGELEETISDLEASTFNLVNGKLEEVEMDKKAVFAVNRSKFLSLKKFTLPAIKEGSVIEYRYQLQSPFYFNFRTWEFQSNIPKASSEFTAYLPGNYNYNVLLRGYLKLSDQKSAIDNDCIRFSGIGVDCSKMTYIMNNVPAFIEEEYMTAPSNFKSAIYFELSDVQAMNGAKQAFTKTWKDVDFELITDKNIGGQMKRKDVFASLVPTLIAQSKDELDKAKAIYQYIKTHLRWNNYYAIHSDENMKTILLDGIGTVADINYSLVAALTAANLNVEAVLLSTRENGTVNSIYPVITEFNYVVAKVNIGDQTYLLDATDPLLPFGLLPLRCINGKGRVINLKKPSYWIDLRASQKSVNKYTLNGKLDENGKILATITISAQGYEALNKRRAIKKERSFNEYVEKLDESLPKMSIIKHRVLNLDSVENPLIENYEVEFAENNEIKNKEQLYLNAFLISRITKNPFNLNERLYPVDLGSLLDERISIHIALPQKYKVIDKPQDMGIGLPNNGGKYLIQTQINGEILTLNQILQLNKETYPAEEYFYLKEFYSRIIQNQKTDVLLKKSND